LLNMLGGINQGATVSSFEFACGQTWSTASPSQPAITEASSVSGQTANTNVRAQVYNTVQIFQNAWSVSYAKQSTYGNISGIAITGQDNPVNNEIAFQKLGALKKMANDLDYTLINGTFQAAANATTAAKTRGVLAAISTNAVAAGSALLDKDMLDALFVLMANSAEWQRMVLIGNAFQTVQVSSIYGAQPLSYNIGGMAIDSIKTDFGQVGVMYEPNMPTDSLALVDLAAMRLMFCPVSGNLIVDETLAKTGAAESGQLYAQIGLDYGIETFHGKITGLATSK
jgi:hypothetical protein